MPEKTYLFPTFVWDEEDVMTSASMTNARTNNPTNSAFIHGSTRIPGKEGLLPDTGAVHNLSSLSAILRQEAYVKAAGKSIQWQKLDKPKQVAGVGDNAKQCTHQAFTPCGLPNGEVTNYHSPVIADNSDIPSLLGLNSMAEDNTFFGTRNGLMAQVPSGTENKINWPKGTSFRQCEKAPSGHWLLIISEFGGKQTYHSQETSAEHVENQQQQQQQQPADE